MLFARRRPLPFRCKLERALWPAGGLKRALRYWVLRASRAKGTPYALAMGLACGVFSAFVPLIGAQVALALAMAHLARASLATAIAGTFIGTPFTYPAIWGASFLIGSNLVGCAEELSPQAVAASADRLWMAALSGSQEAVYRSALAFWPLYLPTLIGGLLLGVLAGALAYYIAFGFSTARRRMRDIRSPSNGGLGMDGAANG